MRNVLFYFVSLFSLSIFAQTNPASSDTLSTKQPVSVPQIVVKVAFGKLTSFGDTALKVNKIIDSRCPSDVTCIWAGNVVVEYSVYKDGKFSENCTMTLGASEKDEFLLNTVNSTLKAYSVIPYPKSSDRKINQEDYIFNVVWQKLKD